MARMASGRLFQRRGAAFENEYVACIVEPPAGERPRSVAHGSAGNELVGRLSLVLSVYWPTLLVESNGQGWVRVLLGC